MPATQRKPAQQPKDAYAQTGKALTSQVQRLRGWISTDASRLPELVDTLNALVAHRLDGHAYAAAGADAQDAVKRSADLLLSTGPIGPYSGADDVARCGTALVQLAALQAAVGLVDAAGATLDSWEDVRRQVAEAGTVVELSAAVGRHALGVAARVALAAGDPAGANAYADAALAVSGPPPAETGFGAVDLDRLASDVRWAANCPEQSLGFLHTAKEAYERVVGDRLADPARLAPALAERLTEPLPGLYADLADRLGALGEVDLALANRRQLVARLEAFAERSDTFRTLLAAARTDLAADLLGAGRAEEAAEVGAPASGAPAAPARAVVARGAGTVSWTPLDAGRAYGAPLVVAGGGATAVPTWLEQERAEARREESARAEEARREAEERAAEAARAQQAERAAAAERAASEAQEREREEARRWAADEAEQAETKRRREERLRQHQAEVEAREREERSARRAEIDARLAELDAAEEPARDRLLAERALLAEAGTFSEPSPEPAPDDLVLAERALGDARTGGGRRDVRAALEAVVDLLRARHAADPTAYAARLRTALEELSSARLRGGDLFGARAASREARTLR